MLARLIGYKLPSIDYKVHLQVSGVYTNDFIPVIYSLQSRNQLVTFLRYLNSFQLFKSL
jgi:hypothetical protein